MIVIDGSALFAILFDEPDRRRCETALTTTDDVLISAASLTELLIVAAGKGIFDTMQAFVDALAPTVVPLTAGRARAAADAYRIWGKGFHPAKLNLGDSFAYALAIEHGCPLLFVGNDFALTDVTAA